jgi:hypothetical protein
MTAYKKLVCFIIVTFVICPVFVAGQITTYNNQLKISLLRLIDFVSPGIEFTYERLISPRTSTELSTSYIGYRGDKSFYKGFRIGLEEKYFTHREESCRLYLSAEAVYIRMMGNENSRYFDTLSLASLPNPFAILKQTATLNIKYGTQLYYNKHFVMDVCIGAGVRYKNIKHKNRIYPFQEFRPTDMDFRASKNEGSSFNFNIPLNVKIGYLF